MEAMEAIRQLRFAQFLPYTYELILETAFQLSCKISFVSDKAAIPRRVLDQL